MEPLRGRIFTVEFTPALNGNNVIQEQHVLQGHHLLEGQWQIRATSQGVCRIVLPTRRHETFPEDALLCAVSTDAEARQAAEHLHLAICQLNEYLTGNRRSFTVSLDPARVTSFQVKVHRTIAAIPFGQTWSYTELAAAMGAPKAVRAVGAACGVNPLPVIVPCHRVIRSDGSLGNYTGGAECKRALLQLEMR